MLLWEALAARARNAKEARNGKEAHSPVEEPARHTQRLPYDTRCSAATKAGTRCRGKIRNDKDFCCFHDPELITLRRQNANSAASRRKRRLKHLPGGYLRKLSDRRTIGTAMDRIYREVRLGMITPEMGRVLFMILCRLLDSGMADQRHAPRAEERTKAAKLRPRLEELLTRAERSEWRKAIANVPAGLFDDAQGGGPIVKVLEARPVPQLPRPAPQRVLAIPVHAAS